ncbi:MAG: DUF2945 domain-containing protein [Patulibacter sp.]|nr:DUF2945 domain-containing protein [Patulibacter sp.]
MPGPTAIARVRAPRTPIMAEQIRKGTAITWRWGNGTAEGTVTAVHHGRVERTIKGEQITRNGSDDDPALEIEQDDGTKVLKLRSEVSRADA